MDPKESIRLLDVLERLGFTNDAFWRLHHFRIEGRKPTINAHRKYCAGISFFADGSTNGLTNGLVQERLKLVLQAYRGGGFKSGKAKVFAALAEAAFLDMPTTRA
jgi:hypothetical protein